jgi:DNA polymerase elongation subunit (family B)
MKRLYFDVETSFNKIASFYIGNKVSVNYNAILEERKIICICYKWEGKDTVYSLTWDKKQCEKQMLKDFLKVAEQADELVGHNGDRFDLPWIRTRCLLNGVKTFPEFVTVDTLKLTRNKFKFNSNRLDYLAQIMGVGKKSSHSGLQLWIDVVNGNKKALSEMVAYCRNDVKILESVYKKLEGYVKPKTHISAHKHGTRWGCPQCGSQDVHCNKTRVTAAGVQRFEMKCYNGCGRIYSVPNSVYSLYKRDKIHDQLKKLK